MLTPLARFAEDLDHAESVLDKACSKGRTRLGRMSEKFSYLQFEDSFVTRQLEEGITFLQDFSTVNQDSGDVYYEYHSEASTGGVVETSIPTIGIDVRLSRVIYPRILRLSCLSGWLQPRIPSRTLTQLLAKQREEDKRWGERVAALRKRFLSKEKRRLRAFLAKRDARLAALNQQLLHCRDQKERRRLWDRVETTKAWRFRTRKFRVPAKPTSYFDPIGGLIKASTVPTIPGTRQDVANPVHHLTVHANAWRAPVLRCSCDVRDDKREASGPVLNRAVTKISTVCHSLVTDLSQNFVLEAGDVAAPRPRADEAFSAWLRSITGPDQKTFEALEFLSELDELPGLAEQCVSHARAFQGACSAVLEELIKSAGRTRSGAISGLNTLLEGSLSEMSFGGLYKAVSALFNLLRTVGKTDLFRKFGLNTTIQDLKELHRLVTAYTDSVSAVKEPTELFRRRRRPKAVYDEEIIREITMGDVRSLAAGYIGRVDGWMSSTGNAPIPSEHVTSFAPPLPQEVAGIRTGLLRAVKHYERNYLAKFSLAYYTPTGVRVEPTSLPFLSLLDGAGLRLDLGSLWEICPWSWFVDYFVNIGEVLGHWKVQWVRPEVTLIEGIVSETTRTQILFHHWNRDCHFQINGADITYGVTWDGPQGLLGESKEYVRCLVDSVSAEPTPRLHFEVPSWYQLVTGLEALL